MSSVIVLTDVFGSRNFRSAYSMLVCLMRQFQAENCLEPYNFITLKVNVSDNEAPSTSRIIKKTISTTLMIKSGETVVIGGILKESKTEDSAGIPVLRDIPFLGWLFKARTKAFTRKELLIFITPTVLPAPTRSL